jgi:hypothetical protein
MLYAKNVLMDNLSVVMVVQFAVIVALRVLEMQIHVCHVRSGTTLVQQLVLVATQYVNHAHHIANAFHVTLGIFYHLHNAFPVPYLALHATVLLNVSPVMLDISSIQPKINAKSVPSKSQIAYSAMKVYVFNVHMDIPFHLQTTNAFPVPVCQAAISVQVSHNV